MNNSNKLNKLSRKQVKNNSDSNELRLIYARENKIFTERTKFEPTWLARKFVNVVDENYLGFLLMFGAFLLHIAQLVLVVGLIGGGIKNGSADSFIAAAVVAFITPAICLTAATIRFVINEPFRKKLSNAVLNDNPHLQPLVDKVRAASSSSEREAYSKVLYQEVSSLAIKARNQHHSDYNKSIREAETLLEASKKLSESDGKIDGNLLILNDGSQWVRRSKVQDALATDDNQLPF